MGNGRVESERQKQRKKLRVVLGKQIQVNHSTRYLIKRNRLVFQYLVSTKERNLSKFSCNFHARGRRESLSIPRNSPIHAYHFRTPAGLGSGRSSREIHSYIQIQAPITRHSDIEGATQDGLCFSKTLRQLLPRFLLNQWFGMTLR